VFDVRRKLIAAAGAAGLALGIAGHVPGSAAQAPPGIARAAQHARSQEGDGPHLKVLEKPGRHFNRSLEAARQQATTSASGSSQGFASPELLGVSSSTLSEIAACESGGDPRAVSADGTYRGLYQFDYGTWQSVGGTGDPAAASAAEQSYRAALLLSRSGTNPWPICG
jgi:Transglycosylase-like domain